MLSATPLDASSPLKRFVDGFWAFESAGQAHRVLPDGCIDFIFDLDAGRAKVVGPMTRAEVVALPTGVRLFGVRFLPGAASAFIDADAHALEDREAELDELTSARSLRMAERIAEATDDHARRRLVTDFLFDPRSRIRATPPRLHQAVRAIRHSRGALPVSAIAKELGLGERTLERIFREHVGLRPKLFARIVRMEWTNRLAARHASSQASLAHHCGYADEPHLVREFRSLTRLTPAALLAERRVGFVQVAGDVSG
jgi:AraC-like DNA-binding protein